MDYEYDMFISYSHEDRSWAEKVYDLLRKQRAQYKMFFDRDSLRAGSNWEKDIQKSLENCCHLILIWSDHAKQSDWVTHELTTFRLTAKPSENKNRRLICLNLQGTNQTINSFQQISRPEIQNSYPEFSKLKEADWKQLIIQIDDGLNPDKRPLAVPLVVLTLDRLGLDNLSQGSLANVKNDFRLTEDYLRTRYGRTRDDWRPFASAESITTILDQARERINTALQNHRLDWRLPDTKFWTDVDAANDFVNTDFMKGELSVLVIDPVAIYQHEVYQRLMLLQECFTNERTVIVTLPPFNIPGRVLRLRDALKKRGMPYFEDYFKPTVPPRRRLAAQCSWNVSDVGEVERHILAAASHLVPEGEAGSLPAYLSHGSKG
jgi:hypothetical protein